MKIIKATQLEITTSVDGSLYTITNAGTVVPDEVASKMKEQFLHTVEVSDFPNEKVEEKVKETVEDIVPEDPIIE